MKPASIRAALPWSLALLVLSAPPRAQDPARPDAGAANPAAANPAALARGPLLFVANAGQWRPEIAFAAERGAVRHWLAADGLWVAAEQDGLGAALRFSFAGSRHDAPARGVTPHPARLHFLRGDARVTDVPTYVQVAQPGLYDDTDLVLRSVDGHLEYDLELQAGADLSRVTVRVAGHQRMRLLPDGSLSFLTALGELRQTPPTTWCTDRAGRRRELPSRFVVRGDDRFGFAVDGWQDGALTIDPGLVWGSFLGGANLDRCTGIGADSQGNAVVVGTTTSTDFPTTPGSYRPNAVGGADAFVAKFDAAGGSLLWATYLGGSLDEEVDSMQVLPGDEVVIGGSTDSFNYPVTANRFQAALAGGRDGFVTRLASGGNVLAFSSYYGGVGDQTHIQVFVEPDNDIWIAGRTAGTVPTTANSLQGARSGPADIFLGVLDRSSPGSTSLFYGTYYGGSGDETRVDSLFVDAFEIATIGATTTSTNIQTTPTYYSQTLVGTPPCGWLVCIQPTVPTANQLVYSSYFGAGGGSTDRTTVAVDSDGFWVVAATTGSSQWQTSPVSAQQSYGGGASDGLVCRFNSGGTGATSLLLATYLGGSGDEVIEAIDFQYATSSVELLSVVGSTTSTDFPVTGSALQRSPAGTGRSGFFQLVNFRAPGPTMRQYSTYYDGCNQSDDELLAVARVGTDRLVAGTSVSSVVPGTPGAFQINSGGGQEGVVARLDLQAQPSLYSVYGNGGCGQPGTTPAFAFTTNQPPRMCQQFRCTVNNLAPNNVGIMAMGLSDQAWFGLPLPLDLGGFAAGMAGCNLLQSADTTFLVFHTGTSTDFGFQVPGSMLFYGIDLYLQFFEQSTAAGPPGPFVASNGARLNIQY